MKNRTRLWKYAALWFLVLTCSGAFSGYFASARGGHRPPVLMTLIGAIWGGFIGSLFCLEVVNVPLPIRRILGVCLGVAASCVSGILFEWDFVTMLLVGVFAAILGAFADLWVKHVSVFP
jgi:hypothetical protein